MSQASVSGSSRTVAGFSDDARGVTPPSSSSGRHEFLSEVIVELGFADPGTVEEAVEAAREPGMTVEKILLERGALDEDQLARAIAERHGLDFVDLDEFDVDADAMKLITRSAGLRYRAAPIAFSVDGALIVALEDPVDVLAVNDISVMTRSEVRVAVAGGRAIEGLIECLPDPRGQEAKKGRRPAALGALIGSGAAPSWSPDALAKSAPPKAEPAVDPPNATADSRDQAELGSSEPPSTRERDEALERAVAERERALQEAKRALSERERGRQQSALREQKLRAELRAAAQRKDELEDQLAKFLPLATEMRDALERLAALQREDGSVDADADEPDAEGSPDGGSEDVEVFGEEVHGAWRPRAS